MNKNVINAIKSKAGQATIGVATVAISLGLMVGQSFAAAADYAIPTGTQAQIGDMTTGSTQSFFSVFTANWPVLAVFAIGITAFFFFWRLIQKFLHQSH